jgi:hypothetical protein
MILFGSSSKSIQHPDNPPPCAAAHAVLLVRRRIPLVRRRFPATFMPMSNNPKPAHWITLVVKDVQFWIPVVVLIGGLLVLSWIA